MRITEAGRQALAQVRLRDHDGDARVGSLDRRLTLTASSGTRGCLSISRCLSQKSIHLSLCEVLHTCWKATLLGDRGEGRREKGMADVATALVESSLAETLLVVIVAMAVAVVAGVLVRQA